MEKKNYRKDLLFFIIKIFLFYILSFLIFSFGFRFFENYHLDSGFFSPINKYINYKLQKNEINQELDNEMANLLKAIGINDINKTR